MSDTLVIQSHRTPLPYTWLSRCLDSVRDWCAENRFDYRFIGDELFNYVPKALLEKTQHQPVIATDIARLVALQEALAEGYQRVVWLDADFLVIDAAAFVLPDEPYSVGREVWVQRDGSSKLRVYKKVHNAFLMFTTGNTFLEFYLETALRLLAKNSGTVPPQFVGPKLLTALHNVAQLPVMESAGMLSPLVIDDIVRGGGEALDLFIAQSPESVAGANLCISSRERKDVSCDQMERLIDTLSANGIGGPSN